MRPDVSVIISARDRLWSLPQCVDSCRSTSISVEIIVVDDASTDGTADWLKTQKDVVTISGEGWGKPWAVTKALSVAQGTYVRFLDSDDWLSPGANEEQFAIGERERADLVVAGYDLYRDQALIQTFPWEPTDDFVARQLGEGLAKGSHYSAFLFRRSFIRDIPHRTSFVAADFASRDDRCFILEVALRRPVIAVYDGQALCHRHHDRGRLQFQSGLRSVGTNIQHLQIYRQILSMLDHAGELTPRRRRAAASALWPLATWIGYLHPREAADVSDWIYELDPTFVPPVPGLLGFCYRKLGFRHTQQLLRYRRTALAPFRKARRMRWHASAEFKPAAPHEPRQELHALPGGHPGAAHEPRAIGR
jgi:glycosyltransferase involved in cell wall biosynthesis